VEKGHRVAGSIAPLEDCYTPGASPGEASRLEHRELARVLADASVDVILCETFPHAVEARVAVEEAARTGIETWVALTAGPDGSLMTPEAMRSAAQACVAAGARAVLVNCTAATKTLAYVEALSKAYANAGRADDRLGWDDTSEDAADRYAALARSWLGAGATLVGGCCGTGPAHIAALSRLL
jgi:S-methylmethionine-dependent homocysteine/selenocysteine methylase